MQLSRTLPQWLHSFFHEWLLQQRNISVHTVRSYRDTWRLLLRFIAQLRNQTVAKILLEQITSVEVLAFLQHCEQERKASIDTRNCRLSAIRSFFSFVAEREPLLAAQCAAILRIPTKRTLRRTVRSLDVEEVKAILAQPNLKTEEGQRDYTLLALLYNSGARIQEALNLCPRDIRFESPARIRLMGKGGKERYCPLWPETVKVLRALFKRKPRSEHEPIFVNRYGSPLGASGVRYRLQQYVRAAAEKTPSLKEKRVSPHLFRHTTAVHLVASGVDLTVIQNLLGHASPETTNLYAQANLETKRQALDKIGHRPAKVPRWKLDQDLMRWLDSL